MHQRHLRILKGFLLLIFTNYHYKIENPKVVTQQKLYRDSTSPVLKNTQAKQTRQGLHAAVCVPKTMFMHLRGFFHCPNLAQVSSN